MGVEIKVPSPGESISEVEIANWLVSEGDYVEKDQVIAEIDSDKATLEVAAEESGAISILAEEGDTVAVGAVICTIDASAKRPTNSAKSEPEKEEKKKEKEEELKDKETPETTPVSKPASKTAKSNNESSYAKGLPSVAAKKIMDENGISSNQIQGTGKDGRITKTDVLAAMSAGFSPSAAQGWGGTRDVETEKMTSLRKMLSKRLVAVKNETAMLTTFNEVDMKPIMDLRKKYKEAFKENHGVGLGFMSFFTKAVTEALAHFPKVNSQITEDNEILNFNYADIGIAVSSPKGLMVPVVRNAEQMSLAEIEAEIKRLALKARDGKITLDEMTGGTFTITNGGVFGSMLSTPIINPPQSAILGMHNIVERPVAINGKVEIRPIMYVALSYDHRIIDGKESVGFLVKVKEMLENPVKMIFGAKAPEEVLLGL
jgi:2-oxoglutarate dehydrogenase E2 component (dihydrolipoamide succinyltransferase)